MNKIDDLKDETIRTLAQTLKTSGLAASESEAIRMATNMAQTNKKANTTFEERKEKNIMGLSFLHKEYKKDAPKQHIIQEETYAEEMPKQEITQEEIYQEETTTNPNYDNQETTTQNTQYEQQEEHNCTSCQGCGHDDFIEEDKPLNKLFETETKDEYIKQEIIEDEPEVTKEIPVQKDKPKRDLSEFKESKVDLGDVFRFKG
ncbi:MAG: hypothetical protein ACLFN8_02870 [Candidatus Woesearchaeota archaeon]